MSSFLRLLAKTVKDDGGSPGQLRPSRVVQIQRMMTRLIFEFVLRAWKRVDYFWS